MLDLSLIIAAHLLGSISSAIVVCRLMGLPDPRTQGSNNPGAIQRVADRWQESRRDHAARRQPQGFVPVACVTCSIGRSDLLRWSAPPPFSAISTRCFSVSGRQGRGHGAGRAVRLGWTIGGAVAAPGCSWPRLPISRHSRR